MIKIEKDKIFLGDNIDIIKNFPNDSVDSIVTDPPYGIKFMNKKWDHDVPKKEFWEECKRILKPGSHVLSFCGTKTYHRMTIEIEDAEFEIRDCLSWIYGEGFPKGIDLSNGFNTALKPAQELICLARKPIGKNTIKENFIEYKTGGLNIDSCRIGNEEININYHGGYDSFSISESTKGKWQGNKKKVKGRWPSNVILDEESSKELDNLCGEKKSGELKEGFYKDKIKKNVIFGVYGNYNNDAYNSNSGGISRFFYCSKTSKKEKEFLCDILKKKKVNDGRKTEIDNPYQRGESERLNTHTTVKPLKLMQYLVTLVTPPGGIVLDPFIGSGSTAIGAKMAGNYYYIGIEKESEYYDICMARLRQGFLF